jgi:hypothetical protein
MEGGPPRPPQRAKLQRPNAKSQRGRAGGVQNQLEQGAGEWRRHHACFLGWRPGESRGWMVDRRSNGDRVIAARWDAQGVESATASPPMTADRADSVSGSSVGARLRAIRGVSAKAQRCEGLSKGWDCSRASTAATDTELTTDFADEIRIIDPTPLSTIHNPRSTIHDLLRCRAPHLRLEAAATWLRLPAGGQAGCLR